MLLFACKCNPIIHVWIFPKKDCIGISLTYVLFSLILRLRKTSFRIRKTSMEVCNFNAIRVFTNIMFFTLLKPWFLPQSGFMKGRAISATYSKKLISSVDIEEEGRRRSTDTLWFLQMSEWLKTIMVPRVMMSLTKMFAHCVNKGWHLAKEWLNGSLLFWLLYYVWSVTNHFKSCRK